MHRLPALHRIEPCPRAPFFPGNSQGVGSPRSLGAPLRAHQTGGQAHVWRRLSLPPAANLVVGSNESKGANMATIRDILAAKHPEVLWVDPETSVHDAALLMSANWYKLHQPADNQYAQTQSLLKTKSTVFRSPAWTVTVRVCGFSVSCQVCKVYVPGGTPLRRNDPSSPVTAKNGCDRTWM